VPKVLILTKADKVCLAVDNDLSMIFNSENMSTLIHEAAGEFGLPHANVLPFKNYERELEADNKVELLALWSLRQILHCSYGFIDMKSTLTREIIDAEC
ncbi:hypothetical protein ACJMK2_038223, partial [Sinanodonta woodiana]